MCNALRGPYHPDMRLRGVVILLLFLLAPGLLLPFVWPLHGLGAGEDDVMYYLPARIFLGECVQRGEWPWINPFTGMGRPFVADPQSAVWYPFTWLFAWFAPLKAYPIHIWLHEAIAACGMYRLLRMPTAGRDVSPFSPRAPQAESRIGRAAAVFGAITFAYCGFFLAHRVHLTIHAGAAWTPWVFWRMRRFADAPSPARLLWVALVAALQTLSGHVQIAALTALGSLVWIVASRVRQGGNRTNNDEVALSRPTLRSQIGCWFLAWSATAALCAIQLIPTLEYLRICDRGDRDYFAFTENSWDPASLATFIAPLIYGNRVESAIMPSYHGPSHQSEQLAYIGLLPLILAGFACVGGWHSHPQRRGWVMLLVFSVLLAIGRFGPICPLLYFIPGANVFRVPARALLLVDLALCALAASMLQQLLFEPLSARVARALADMRDFLKRPWVVAVGGVAAAIVIAAGMLFVQPATKGAMIARSWIGIPQIIAFLLLLSSAAMLLAIVRWRIAWETGTARRSARSLVTVTVLLVGLDLAWLGAHVDIPHGVDSVGELLASGDRDAIIAEIEREPKPSNPWLLPRLWVVNGREGDRFGEYERPLAKLCADSNVIWRIPTLNDYGPMQPREFVHRYGFAPWGYTPLARRMLLVTDWMMEANVGWVLVCDPAYAGPRDGDLRLTTASGYRLYRMSAVDSAALDPFAGTSYVPQWLRYDSVSLAAPSGDAWRGRTPAFITRPSVVLEGWTADLIPIENTDRRMLSWKYFPPGLVTGATLSGIALAVLVILALASMRRSRRA